MRKFLAIAGLAVLLSGCGEKGDFEKTREDERSEVFFEGLRNGEFHELRGSCQRFPSRQCSFASLRCARVGIPFHLCHPR